MQIRSLGRLEFDVEYYGTQWEEDDDSSYVNWSRSFSLERVWQLTGLRCLRLKLSSWFLCRIARTKKSGVAYTPDDVQTFSNALKNFQELHLKEVIVEINNSGSESLMKSVGSLKEEGIECVRRTLLTSVTEPHQEVEDHAGGEMVEA